MDFKVVEVAASEAVQSGFAKFNHGRHLCVEVPRGNSTITVKTPEGKQITLAFIPYEPEGSPVCVDIHHATGESTECGLARQDVILFGNGSYKDPYNYGNYMKQEGAEDKPHTLTTLILEQPK